MSKKNEVNMFERATRNKLRVATPKGASMEVEDLWDLKLEDLAATLTGLNHQIKDLGEENYLEETDNKATEILKFKFSVVKHILDTKKEEKKAAADAAKVRKERNKIEGLIAQKEDEELSNKSPEELRDMLNKL